MVRAIVSFPGKDLKRMDRLARKLKKSRAQLIREAVHLYIKHAEKQKIEGQNFERQLQSEWEAFQKFRINRKT